ncbi:peptidoglycan-associated lipoprotein Pal [Hydrogenophaga electricum]|uniref:Peptidoglycan-associated lipoprotein n=1 Tax=Hydrogenophaga electricum TaxID=1230953 RepID=A0ABQ6C2G9_9BURK|nr:peptidoglycan-associated lipoprotein Pal [Hydrogenophaga electricum]GLS14492.1 hypothetical protein GCM10007935_19230 [Hydrogenophaga electricum]
MKTPLLLWSGIAVLLGGCASVSRDGSDQQAYYYAYKPQTVAAPQVLPLQAPPAAAPGRGPADVAHIVYFGFDQWHVEARYQGVVAQHGAYLRAHPQRKVFLEGHTDERGGTEYNLSLGQRRAEAVRSELRRLGVADQQLEAVSFGEEKPVDLSRTEEGYQLNRRVEFNYR